MMIGRIMSCAVRLTDAGEDEEDHKGVEDGHDGQRQGREDLHYNNYNNIIRLYDYIVQYPKELSTGTMASARAVRI